MVVSDDKMRSRTKSEPPKSYSADPNILPTVRPTLSEAKKMDFTGNNPSSRYSPIAFNPAEATQPHCEQSGLPPNWQGVILPCKSAVTESVVRAKIQSSGDRGGRR